MKHCDNCKKDVDTEEEQCPICGEKLIDELSEEDAAMIVASTTLLM